MAGALSHSRYGRISDVVDTPLLRISSGLSPTHLLALPPFNFDSRIYAKSLVHTITRDRVRSLLQFAEAHVRSHPLVDVV